MKNVVQILRPCVRTMFLLGVTLPLGAAIGYGQANNPDSTSPAIVVTVEDITTGLPISSGETITAGDQFQVTVNVTNNVDCAGQFVVTALGAPGAPPEVLVQNVIYIIGPASGGNSATGGVLTSNGTPGHPNKWKISASCDGALAPAAFGFARFQFTSAVE
jgi:hypothetical protein